MRMQLVEIFAVSIFLALALEIKGEERGPEEALSIASGKLRIGLFNPRFSPAERKEEQKAYVKETLKTIFDFRELGKNILKDYYPADPVAERKFLRALAEYIAVVFLIHTRGYDDLNFALNRTTEGEENPISVTVARIKNGTAEKYEMKFWMRFIDGKWKIYWLETVDFNIISNLSSQFRHVVRRGSIETLIVIMQSKKTD